MSSAAIKLTAHIVDVLGNVVGRDQPILRMEKALEMVSLLGPDTFLDDNVVFFDPFCKAGELLLACAFHSCWAKGKGKQHLLDAEMVLKEIYHSNRYFGLSPDERHHRLSRRTFLGNTHSHNEEFNHIIRDGHYLSEIDGRLDSEKFEKEFNSMIEYINTRAKNKRLIAVGNPPYQENDGGFGGSATSVYNYFVESIMEHEAISELLVVIPSRWFTTGKGTSRFREKILSSKTVRAIRHFRHSKLVFPTVDILGGVCFFHHDSKHCGKTDFSDGLHTSAIDLSESDIILDDPKGYEISNKIKQNWKGDFVSSIAWTVRPFGIRTFYFARKHSLNPKDPNAIPCFTKRRKVQYADMNDITRNRSEIPNWKVAVPKAYAPGSKLGVRRVTLPVNQFFIIPKGHITTETYNVVGSFRTKTEAENFHSFLITDFARYLLGLRKVTQDIYKNQWEWVPLVDVSQPWTDEKLFKMFKLSREDREHISKKLREWS